MNPGHRQALRHREQGGLTSQAPDGGPAESKHGEGRIELDMEPIAPARTYAVRADGPGPSERAWPLSSKESRWLRRSAGPRCTWSRIGASAAVG